MSIVKVNKASSVVECTNPNKDGQVAYTDATLGAPIEVGRHEFDMALSKGRERSLIDFLAGRGVGIPPLRVVDVGVSGGIDPIWRAWGDRLSALGIDAIVDEVERLSRVEELQGISYTAARIIGPAVGAGSDATRSNYALHRSQAYLATAILRRMEARQPAISFNDIRRISTSGALSPLPLEASYANVVDRMSDPFYSYYARRFARHANPRITDFVSTLDDLIGATPAPHQVDVLKIDTDGHEFDVLRGGQQTLGSGCLAVEVEVQFHGPLSSTSNVFCNIDAFLRESGFTLFKLEPVQYNRSALPRPFLFDIPAQNNRGQVVWADALYARDLANRASARLTEATERDRIQNLALIFDLYGLEDAAAELIVDNPGLFDGIDDQICLDHLASKIHGQGITYQQVTDAFLRDPVGFHKGLGDIVSDEHETSGPEAPDQTRPERGANLLAAVRNRLRHWHNLAPKKPRLRPGKESP